MRVTDETKFVCPSVAEFVFRNHYMRRLRIVRPYRPTSDAYTICNQDERVSGLDNPHQFMSTDMKVNRGRNLYERIACVKLKEKKI